MEKIFFNMVLSNEQLSYLAKSQYGFNRSLCFTKLLQKAVWQETSYEKKGFKTLLQVGQFAVSEVELAKEWKCNRRTVARFIGTLNRRGIIKTITNNRTSIHSLLCLNGWVIDGNWIKNHLFVRPNEKVHTSLPQRGTATQRVVGTQQEKEKTK